jgi:hypothetical protein
MFFLSFKSNEPWRYFPLHSWICVTCDTRRQPSRQKHGPNQENTRRFRTQSTSTRAIEIHRTPVDRPPRRGNQQLAGQHAGWLPAAARRRGAVFFTPRTVTPLRARRLTSLHVRSGCFNATNWSLSAGLFFSFPFFFRWGTWQKHGPAMIHTRCRTNTVQFRSKDNHHVVVSSSCPLEVF